MKWWGDGSYSHKANEVTWSLDVSSDAKLMFDLVASSITQPVFITYKAVQDLTGWSPKRISSAVRELVTRKIVICRRGGLRHKAGQKRKASEYSINPDRKAWQVGRLLAHPCVSLPPWKRERDLASGMEATSLPERKTNKEGKTPKNVATQNAAASVSSVASDPIQRGRAGHLPDPAEVERYAMDPDFIDAFGSSENVRAHFNQERGRASDRQEDGTDVAKDGFGDVQS